LAATRTASRYRWWLPARTTLVLLALSAIGCRDKPNLYVSGPVANRPEILPEGCGDANPEVVIANSEQFVVAVAGDGAGDGGASEAGDEENQVRVYPLNRAQGHAMWLGAMSAYNSSPNLTSVKSLFRPVGCDDRGSEAEAGKIARGLALDPHVLAVIGHATSGTTRSAALHYAGAGIPLLMPIATSPYAAFPPPGRGAQKRLLNCFRLPGSDTSFQAPAVVFLLKQQLRAKRPYLIKDVSADAKEYSEPLFGRIAELLSDVQYDHFDFDRNGSNIQNLMMAVRGWGPDTIVFCGYGSNASIIFAALREIYARNKGEKRPAVVLTDGCKIPDLDIRGFHVLLTFPLPEVDGIRSSTRDYPIFSKAIARRETESYQMSGYDAMLIVGRAAQDCILRDNKLSRACILEKIGTLNEFLGVCLHYTYAQGENSSSQYYVYESFPIGSGQVKSRVFPITKDELNNFFAPGYDR